MVVVKFRIVNMQKCRDNEGLSTGKKDDLAVCRYLKTSLAET